ncbi:MAG: 4-alpha-glucanotransferase [Phycisphaerales bacterium]|nr:4-alpha-glucanotransferase [Phycisphaerales bacterium]
MNPGPLVATPRFALATRSAGVLLHPTSLPSPHGVGDLGSAARAFVDFLSAAGLRWWQMLPTHPPGPGNSPYSALSAFAISPLLISLDQLAAQGWLEKRDLKAPAGLPAGRVVYPAVAKFKRDRLRRAFLAFLAGGGLTRPDYRDYCDRNAAWLDPFAFFMALRTHLKDKPWTTWPDELRRCSPDIIRRTGHDYRDHAEFERFCQWLADQQWSELRQYAHDHGVALLGDIPIFVAPDSADVWSHQHLFDLEADGRPRTQSGVPPDMFSKTGQLWRHPQYRWDRHEKSGFAWWLSRFRRCFDQFDAVRLDHFIGYHRVWSVPGRDKTAKNGKWVPTPGRALFRMLRGELGAQLQVIAEDLGATTSETHRLRDEFGFPGMRLLHFAWGTTDDAGRENQPHNFPRSCVVYPGTHDNETTVGWFRSLRAAAAKRRAKRGDLTAAQRALRYLGTTGREIHWDLIRLAFASPACTAVIPAQDLLGLDNRARMNTPATERGNWEWRLLPNQLNPRIAARLRELGVTYERIPTSSDADQRSRSARRSD